jgi:hypothetical protein
MTVYATCLVLHVLGAVGLFAALGIEGAGLFALVASGSARRGGRVDWTRCPDSLA